MAQMATLPPREDGFVRKKWSMKECKFLVESGLLTPGKYELIEGEIIFKMGQGRIHVAAITRIVAALASIFGIESIQNQAQIGIGEKDEFNDPEPDIAVLRGKVGDYVAREPDPSSEVILAVEAANTSVLGDTTIKAQLYAQNVVPEYWVVVIPRRELIVYRDPSGGKYQDIVTLSESESVSPLAAPASIINVADLLP